MNVEYDIEMGSTVRDRVTGFEGVVISFVHYLYGCDFYGVKPRVDKDGKMQEEQWLDPMRLEVIAPPDKAMLKDQGKTASTGGPMKGSRAGLPS